LVARIGEVLKSPKAEIEDRLAATIDELKTAHRRLAAMQAAELATRIPDLVARAQLIGATKFVETNLGALSSVDDLRTLATQIREQLAKQSAVIALFAVIA